jgi:flagellar protein FlgJ
MATKSEIREFIETVYPAAKNLYGRGRGVHPLFTVAQAALETGWKTGGIRNNIFGITKGSAWTGRTQLVLTTEYFNTPAKRFASPEEVVSITPLDDGRYRYRVYRLFRVYDSLEDCLEDHFSLLRKSGYADAWPYRDDPREYARRIVDAVGAKYATAPDYAAAMIGCIGTVEKYVNELGL